MMNRRRLVVRALAHYWRTNLAVIAGVAAAVSVLTGALVVGDSVRGTLRALALDRLGATDLVVTAPRFFREGLTEDIHSDSRFASRFDRVAPVIVTQGLVTAQVSGRRAGRVLVYGVDERFWRFHGLEPQTTGDREALVSPALAAEIGLATGDATLVRMERPSAIPLESLHSDKDAVGRTMRLTVARVLGRESLSEFALQPRQGEVRALFVTLRRLQAELEVEGRANTMLVARGPSTTGTSDDLELLLRDHAALADVGLKLVPLPLRHSMSVEAEAGLLTPLQVKWVEEALETTLIESTPVLTYVANEMRSGDRRVPYSLITAIDLETIAPQVAERGPTKLPPIVLNDWAASDLIAREGDVVRVEYYVWEDAGGLSTRSAEFQVAGVVPVGAADRDFAPSYRGITDSPTIDSWDPPFPVDLRTIRPRDELYWERYRTAPKAFIPLDVGQRLWGSRHGALTSVRLAALAGRDLGETVAAFDDRLRSMVDPVAVGATVADVRGPALAASAGATDFGEYFLYFSFFLVVAALVLASLFFRLGVEQRAREVGLLRAVGVDVPTVRRLLTSEAIVLSGIGTAAGLAGAVGYAWLVIKALTTWWVDAVGTTALTVHVTLPSLVAGSAGGIAAAIFCTWWTLRGLGHISERSLLAGDLPTATPMSVPAVSQGRMLAAAVCATFVATVFSVLGIAGIVASAGAFFGAGGTLLVACLFACAWYYRAAPADRVRGRGWWAVSKLGLRSTRYRPGRSVLSIAVVASATFILIAVDAFRKDAINVNDSASGTGGYELIVESLLPIVHDPETPNGKAALNLSGLQDVTIERFRLRPGDDASCLNLYQPLEPRILGVTGRFVAARRFAFQSSLPVDGTRAENPWALLEQTTTDGTVPVIADITSMNYVLHRALGDEVVIRGGGRPVRLRIVAALRDSVFQSELLMSEANFRALFPEREGYQMLLVDAPEGRVTEISDEIENGLADFGADAVPTAVKLAEFHKVENTYLSTFQTLGGLGLLIGTIGLAAVLLRNVLERRRELALLGALGYRPGHFVLLLAAESLSLVLAGLVVGALSAAVAVLPAVAERGGRLPISTAGALLMVAVLVAGLLSTSIAARLATRGPLLDALRAE